MDHNYANKIVANVASQLAKIRKKRKLSHQNLAFKAGITRAAVSFIESGKRKPTLGIAIRLANALDTNLSELLKKAEAKLSKN